MSTVEFTLDHEGIAELLRGPEMHQMVMDRARGGAAFAAHIAPVRSGEYAAGIVAEDGGLGGANRDRPMGLIVATAPYSAAVEWGNPHQPHPYHVLARTIDIVEAG